MTDERHKKIMADLGMPNSQSLLVALKQVANEASPGDWIIRGVAGEYYPCKPDIFAATYEPAE